MNDINIKTAMMGYDKKDVEEYIQDLTHDFQEKLREKEDEIIQLKIQLRKANEKLERLENVDIITKETSDTPSNMDAKEEVVEIKKSVDAMAELDAIEKRIVESSTEQLLPESNIDKEKQMIGEVLIKAQKTAEAIIEEAKRDVILEKKEIERQIELDKEKLVDLKNEIQKLKSSVTLALRIFDKQLDDTEKTVNFEDTEKKTIFSNAVEKLELESDEYEYK